MYIKIEWPEIQQYMSHPKYPEDCYFDPFKNVWFIPEEWEEELYNNWIVNSYDYDQDNYLY